MSSSNLASNVMVLATAMAAVSGTVILLVFRHHKEPTTSVVRPTKFTTTHHPRPCISVDGKKRVKKKKKVHFAEDVMEPSGNGDEFRKGLQSKKFPELRTNSSLFEDEGGNKKVIRALGVVHDFRRYHHPTPATATASIPSRR